MRTAWLVVLAACGGAEPGLPADPTEAPDVGTTPDLPSEPAGDGEVVLAPAPADGFFLVDTSGSWERKLDRWQGMNDGLATFLDERGAELGLAASTFPRGDDAGDSCAEEDYLAPDLAWPAEADEVVARVAASPIGGGSTLGPALSAALEAARAHQAADPARSTWVMLLTDATPDDDETCAASDWDAVAATAGEGFADGLGPSVHTAVVSVIGTGVSDDHFGRLQRIAVEGGGFAAFVNGSRADVARSTAQALRDVHDRATTCTLLVPDGLVPERLTVTFPSGEATELRRVEDASACDERSFTLDDPEAPSTATLCSGEGGVGGVCEVTFLRARLEGPPTVTARARRG